MKKIIYLSAALFAVVAFSSCKGKTKTKSPGETAQVYVDYIYTGDFIPVMDMMYCEDAALEQEMKREKEQYANTMKKNVDRHVSKKGGVKNTQVISEKVSDDGKNAQVVVRHEYNEAVPEDILYDMTLVDNDWKVKMTPHKEVWKTKTADGKHVSFKLKDNEHKDVLKEHVGDERDYIKDIHTENKDVIKVKEDGEKDVLKIKDKEHEIVIKEKHNGEKEKTVVKKEM